MKLTIMKLLNSKKLGLGLFLFSLTTTLLAGDRYEKRVERYQSRWSKLIPRYTKIQYAGGMGLVSLGTGWDYGKNDHWETDIFFGILPKYSTDKAKITFTLKQNFIPWQKNFNEHFSLEPFTCGLFINSIFHEDFWKKQPNQYPEGYYFFSTKLRFNLYIGQRFTYNIPKEKRFFSKSISLFYEISSNDLYVISAFTNSYLKPWNYLNLSFGLKMQLL